MADKRISQLIERVDIANNDVLPIVASGATTTNKVTVSTLQTWMQDNLDVGVTSVGLSMPSAFVVSNSPVTASGNISVTGAGTVSQYIRGDGSLADFPSGGGGGGSSVNYYLNGSVSQGTIGGIAYQEMNRTPILGAGTDFTIAADGYIASFITDAGDPALLEIPAGNWNFETYLQASSGGGTPSFYIELYKVNSGGTATLIASNSATPELIAFGTTTTPYFSALAVPTTTLALTDRLALRYYVTHSGRTITLHTENATLCQIITTFTTGLTALNGLTAQVQNFATGTSGTDFAISSSVSTHTFNLPDASASARGVVTTGTQTIAGAKTFNSSVTASSLIKTGGTSSQFLMADGSVNTSVLASGAYLPLAGGTLTGALSGTSATFGSTDGIIKANRSTTSFASLFKMSTAGVDNWSLGIPTLSSADWVLFNHATGISNLSFASATGAATFSSSVTASSLIKSGGTSSQFLKADGSVDSSSYLTTGTASSTYLTISSAASTYVTLNTAQTITGLKTFSSSVVDMAIFNSTYATGGVLAFLRNGVSVGNIGNSGSLTVGILDDFEIRSGSSKSIHLRTDAVQFTLSPSGGTATLFSANSSTPTLVLNTTGTNQASGIITQQSGGSRWGFGTNFGSGDDSWNVYNYAAASRFLTIASTGAATFSSSVTATNEISIFSSVAGGTSSININGLGSGGGSVAGTRIDGIPEGSGAAASMGFVTRDSAGNRIEKMRINSVGFLKASNTGTYISSTGAYHELNSNITNDWSTIVRNSSASPYGLQIAYNSTPNNTANDFMWCVDGTAVRLEVRSNGGIANYQANNINLSDERTKKDIEPLESYWDKFKEIEIVKFKYKDQTHDDFNIGVIAQQVEAVAPEFVDVDGWATKPELDEEGNEIISEEEPLKSIYTADLHHATIKVLQEAMAKIEELQIQIDSLKNQIK